MNRISVIALAIGLLVLVFIGSTFLQRNAQKPLPILEGLGGDFILPSTTGDDVQLTDFRDKVVLLNFGFTSCPDVCPTALAKMRKVFDLLPTSATDLQLLFVTIDPERDSIESLHGYLAYFHSSIIGLRGDSQQLQQVASLYKVLYQKETIDSELGYGFLHNDHIYLLDQQGNVRAMYSGSATPQVMADQIASLL